MKKFYIVIILVLTLASANLFASKKKMVISQVKSEFKNEVVEKLKEKYQDQCEITIVEMKELKNLNAKDYDVVLVMDQVIANGKLNKKLNKFIKKQDTKSNIVVFMTAKMSNNTINNNEITTITSASKSENVDKKVKELSIKINEILLTDSNKKT